MKISHSWRNRSKPKQWISKTIERRSSSSMELRCSDSFRMSQSKHMMPSQSGLKNSYRSTIRTYLFSKLSATCPASLYTLNIQLWWLCGTISAVTSLKNVRFASVFTVAVENMYASARDSNCSKEGLWSWLLMVESTCVCSAVESRHQLFSKCMITTGLATLGKNVRIGESTKTCSTCNKGQTWHFQMSLSLPSWLNALHQS